MKKLQDKQTSGGDVSPHYEQCDEVVIGWVHAYVQWLDLPVDRLWVTSDKAVYSRWIGRRISSSYGGAYCFLRNRGVHAILINLDRIDVSRCRAVEVVVAEELIHMRDHLDGDHRGHAKHGYDRIAHRVAQITGASLEDIRSALIPVKRRPWRYVYACPKCGVRVRRKRKGRWSCGKCAPRFDSRFEMRIVEYLEP